MHCEYTWSLDHSCTNKNSAQNGQTFSSSLVFTSIWIVSSSTYTFVHILISGHTANTIDMASSIASNNKVTLHFETSEIAVAVIMGSATQLPSITCQDMWSPNRRHLRSNVTVISCLVVRDSAPSNFVAGTSVISRLTRYLLLVPHPRIEHNTLHKTLNVIPRGRHPSDLASGLQTVSRVSLILGVGSCHDVFCYAVVCDDVTCHATSRRIFRIVCQMKSTSRGPVSCHVMPFHGTPHHFTFCHPFAQNSCHVISCEILSVPMSRVAAGQRNHARGHSNRHV